MRPTEQWRQLQTKGLQGANFWANAEIGGTLGGTIRVRCRTSPAVRPVRAGVPEQTLEFIETIWLTNIRPGFLPTYGVRCPVLAVSGCDNQLHVGLNPAQFTSNLPTRQPSKVISTRTTSMCDKF